MTPTPRILAALTVAMAICAGSGLVWAKSPANKADEPVLMVSMPGEKAGNGVKSIQAHTLIAAPPGFVWQRLTDYDDMPVVLPGYQKSEVSYQGKAKMLDVAQKVSRLLPTYRYRVQLYENPAQRQLRFTRVSGDFKSLTASYKLLPRNGGKETLVVYELNIDPGSRLPGAGNIIRDNTHETLSAFRSHVEGAYQRSVIGKN